MLHMDDGGSASDEAERLRAAVGAFVRQVRARDTMPTGQAAVLGHLLRGTGQLSITDLAVLEGVRHQSMARTVSKLAAAGLIVVTADGTDRRRVVVRPTPAGGRCLRAERDRRAGWIAAAIEKNLDEQDRALCRRIPDVLDRLTADLPPAGK